MSGAGGIKEEKCIKEEIFSCCENDCKDTVKLEQKPYLNVNQELVIMCSTNVDYNIKKEVEINRPAGEVPCPISINRDAVSPVNAHQTASDSSTYFDIHYEGEHNLGSDKKDDLISIRLPNDLEHLITGQSDEELFLCPRCHHRCKTKTNLIRHLKQVHSNAKPFSCSKCEHICKTN